MTGPVGRVGLPGLVPVVYEILVIFIAFGRKKIENRTILELNSTSCISLNDPNRRFFILLMKILVLTETISIKASKLKD